MQRGAIGGTRDRSGGAFRQHWHYTACWWRYFWQPAKMYPTSSGLPKSAQASEMALLYFSFSRGDNFALSNSSTPTLTYWESTNPRKTCCFVVKRLPIATSARVALSSRVSGGKA